MATISPIKHEYEHIGETKGIADHDHDLVHELGKRLDALWRYDQYLSNAEGHSEINKLWDRLKKQDRETVKELKNLISKEIENDCF